MRPTHLLTTVAFAALLASAAWAQVANTPAVSPEGAVSGEKANGEDTPGSEVVKAPSTPPKTGAAAAPAALLGFTPEHAATERALEARFDAQLNPEEERAWLKDMASKPNHVGSVHDKTNAEFMLKVFKDAGFDAHIETFDILYPTPITVGLSLSGDRPFTAKLHEPPVEGDPASADEADALPPYLAFQGDGDVTAPVVYANYGMPEDYETLARLGIDVRGKIVITRYGAGWRGLKPQLAQEHGAIGCLIYSDPADDGYASGDIYPKGGTRPPDGVQRGSVQKMMIYPGDPLTPGIGAVKGAKRLARADAPTILKIPALPISYADAQPFLQAMDGPLAPKAFRGALPITYHVGPSKAAAHLVVKSDWSLKPAYDVIAMMKGSQFPDQWVLRGNHHDGWVNGASDPLAGNVSMLEEAKAFGALAKTGWRPKRTIVYGGWDAEEPGLIGSTEWVEQHADELTRKAVLYVNTDVAGRGVFRAEGTHDLEHFATQVMTDIKDPETGVSVAARRRGADQARGYDQPGPETSAAARAASANADIPLGAMGSGSDYSAFVQHLGIAALDLSYSGESDQGGVYHSVYDTYYHYARFGDPSFAYVKALGSTAGRLVMRAADADLLPWRFANFANTVGVYVDELKKLNADMRTRSETLNRLLDQGAFRLASDPTETHVAPDSGIAVRTLDFAALDQAVAKLKASAKAYDALAVDATDPARSSRANALLRDIDQTLLDPQGLPGRPWFKNLAYAPGVLTGYGAKTLPGVREAIEARRWTEAETYIGRTAAVLNAYATRIDQAAAALKG